MAPRPYSRRAALVASLLAAGCPQDPVDTDTAAPNTTGNTTVDESGVTDSSVVTTTITTDGTTTSTTDGTTTSTTDIPPGTASTGSTSTDDTALNTTTGLDSDGTDTSGTTGDDATTGGTDPVEPAIGDGEFPCCEVGCGARLLHTLEDDVVVTRTATRITTQSLHILQLWDADTLELIGRYTFDEARRTVNDRLLYSQGGLLHLIDTVDGSEVGSFPATAEFDIALDASYVWTADDTILKVYEPDGTLRWSVPGAWADLRAHALPDTLAVFDKEVAPQTLQRFAAADGAVTTSMFIGDMPHWFKDNGRFWTMKDGVHRFHDETGTELYSGNGYPYNGWSTRYMLSGGVRDISAPDVELYKPPLNASKFSGPLVFSWAQFNKSFYVTRIDTDPIQPAKLIQLPEGFDNMTLSIDMVGDAWIVGTEYGKSVDHLGRRVTRGPLGSIAGAPTGRAVAILGGEKLILDLADDCTVATHPPLAGGSAFIHLSGDGGTLIAREAGYPSPNVTIKNATRIYSLPAGELLFQTYLGLSSDQIVDHDISDDGKIWARYWTNTDPGHVHTETLPVTTSIAARTSDVLPKIAPGGGHFVMSDGVSQHLDKWAGDPSWIYVADTWIDDPIVTFDGISHGFIDDQHILVGTYVAPNDQFAGMRIVDLDGLDVQDTPLPDIRRIYRIGTGEILASVKNKPSAIFDPWTGEQLWTDDKNKGIAVAGPNFVLLNRGNHLEVVRWR